MQCKMKAFYRQKEPLSDLEWGCVLNQIRTYIVTVHAYVPSNGICRGFAFKYGKFLLPPRFLTALSVPKVPTCEQ